MRGKIGPFEEVVDSLRAAGTAVVVLGAGTPESTAVSEWVEASFPFASWGRIDWDQVGENMTLKFGDGKTILQAFYVVRRQSSVVRQTEAEDEIHIISSNAGDPIFALSWRELLANADAVFHADSDLWIVCKNRSWCMEKTGAGALGCGRAVGGR